MKYPTQEQIDDLSEEERSCIEFLPATLDLLPKFCMLWTLQDAWSVIQDQL